MKDKKEVIVKCVDNCTSLSIDKWNEDEEYILTFYKSYSGKSFKEKIKDIFRILRGREVIGSELIIDKKSFDKIRYL